MEKMLQERKISSKINYDVLKNLSGSGAGNPSEPAEGAMTTSAMAAATTAATTAEVTAGDYLPEVVNETHLSLKNSSRNR